jgi:dipeptidyl aminopeptidase/acylaminoacyl peptidase
MASFSFLSNDSIRWPTGSESGFNHCPPAGRNRSQTRIIPWLRSSQPVTTEAKMSTPCPRFVGIFLVSLVSSILLSPLQSTSVSAQVADTELRPMTFMDAQLMRNAGSWAPNPDGEWMLYTVSTPNWEEANSQSDIHLVSMREGLPSHRQLTFTADDSESSPTWAPDGVSFVFSSSRDADGGARGSQLYLMRVDGGEAQKITDAEDGVSGFEFSPDEMWLVYRSGPSGQAQLYRLPAGDLANADPVQLTEGEAGIDQWDWAPDSQQIYFTRADSFDEAEKERRDKGFTVDVKNMVTPLSNLWAVGVGGGDAEQLTNDPEVSIDGFVLSDDGKWIGLTGGSAKRYERNITSSRLYADLFLMETATGHIERLTENFEISESGITFSPDGRWVAFGAPDDMTQYSMTEGKAYIREVTDRGGSFRKLGSDFDGSIRTGFWSEDGKALYFGAGIKVTSQFMALDIESGDVRQITNERASISVNRDEDSGVYLINYQDPKTPSTSFTITSLDQVNDRASWVQLADVNPQVREMALGEEVEVEWTSTDGKTVGGVLTYPVGYEDGTRYPLVVSIHGGPASADVLRFNTTTQVYAGAGYAVLRPNYRGSTNYGNAHRTDIVGDYFTLGFDDIMTGVDYLIDEGIVDGDQMGAFGWSAGGHWSNWILTHTDRFKAISSGAGTMNWISMYAQSDVQRNRQFYVGDGFLYEDFDTYFDQSPLKYIMNAKTPTMVHVVEGDPRVPSPQSVELHMALKKLGVPTELFMYPGRSHGIPDARNRLVKAVSEMAWMDHYVRGIGEKFQWEDVLKTLEKEK